MEIWKLPAELKAEAQKQLKEMRQKEAYILPSAKVKLVKAGRHYKVQYMSNKNKRKAIKRLSDTHYMVLSTGEVKKYQKSEKRTDRYDSLYRTFRELRDLINANFFGHSNERFITLTFAKDKNGYRPTVADTEILQKAISRFYRKLRKLAGEIVAIWVLEPHADGHAHLHCLIKFLNGGGYVDYASLVAAWGCGIVDIQKIRDVDSVGSYVSAYLTDMPVSELEELGIEYNTDEVVEKKGKKFVKGARLKYFPANKRIYSATRNVAKPETFSLSYYSALRKIGKTEPDYATSKKIPVGDRDLKIVWQHFKADY